jgi:hypothetical protein
MDCWFHHVFDDWFMAGHSVKLSQHMTNPLNAHYKAALHLLRYLNKMSDYHIAFNGKWVNKSKVDIIA